jgi:hypothetical protein
MAAGLIAHALPASVDNFGGHALARRAPKFTARLAETHMPVLGK